MTDRTGPTQPQPSPAPLQPSRVLAEPADVPACNRDYAEGAADRRALDRHLPRR